MSDKSKNTITTMAVGVVLLIGYAIYAAGRFQQGLDGPETLQSWALTILVFLGGAIVVVILVQIAFRIVLAATIAVRERDGEPDRVERILASSLAEDEMDRLVGMRSLRAGYAVVGAGFVGMLVALAFGVSPVIALHILFGSFAAASMVEGVVTVLGYERGVRHG